jgi:hypothetical protein
MSEVTTTVAKILVRLGLSTAAAGYLTRDAGVSSLEEIAYLDVDEVEVLIKHLNRAGGSTTVGTGATAATSPHAGYAVYTRAESNSKLCVFYLKHQERVSRDPTAGVITLTLVRGYQTSRSGMRTSRRPRLNP